LFYAQTQDRPKINRLVMYKKKADASLAMYDVQSSHWCRSMLITCITRI